MNIVHVCQFSLIPKNGVQAAVWELAERQAELGHEVKILSLGRRPSAAEIAGCQAKGVLLKGATGPLQILRFFWRAIRLRRVRLYHFHSVFIPLQSSLALALGYFRSAYVVSPHGNLGPAELARKRYRKSAYFAFVLRQVLSRARCIVCVSQRECENIRQLVPGVVVENLGNGVDARPFEEKAAGKRAPAVGALRAVFMGKSDIEHKGIDRMFAAARAFPDGVDFHVIPHNQPELRRRFEQLVAAYRDDPAVRVHGPVYGEDKCRAYLAADCYFHLARWEVFGMVLVEAALAGLPLVISKECDLAEEISAAGAGLIVDCSRPDAIETISSWLGSEAFFQAGPKARDWALSRYSSQAVSSRSIELYQRAKLTAAKC